MGFIADLFSSSKTNSAPATETEEQKRRAKQAAAKMYQTSFGERGEEVDTVLGN